MKRESSYEEVVFRRIFYGFIEISRCIDRLEQIEVFLKKYDDCIEFRKKEITKAVYLKYHVEKYLEEMYILKERLMGYLNVLRKYYKHNPSATKRLEIQEKLVNRVLDGIIKTRGLHIHQNRFTDEDINRLELYDLLLKAGSMPPVFEKLAKKEFDRVTKTWLGIVKSNNRELKKLINGYFTYIHVLVFDEKGQVKI